ncbi:hypothetical protein J2T41_006285, partial [Pseudomonas citronellolis]|uniref:putative toxin n=1 Tax=Pseudomonas citronellolis TaxID=53408 RepID=UPI0020A02D94
YNHGDSASGTTGSAISNGTLEIRDPANQQQDVASLSRDVEHANGSISPIFDKEKEQNRLKQVQLIAEIGTQAMDIVRTQGEIKASAEGRKALEKEGKYPPGEGATEQEIKAYQTALENSKAYQDVMREYGTGSSYQQAAQAVTAALQYLAGGDLGGALAGASAPYVAKLIKDQTGKNDTARIMAQAVLGAVVASAQGNSAAAGAAGAATGELIAKQLYPNKPHDQLTEDERQTVSALSSLAAGMAGGLVAGDSGGAVAGASAGKTAVENNDLGGRLYLDKKVEEFAAEGNCGGMSTESCRAKYAEKVFVDGGGANGVMLSVLLGVGAPIAVVLGPELLVACMANPAVCTEASLAGAEMPFGSATAGGAALGMGGFGGLIGKEVAAGADAVGGTKGSIGELLGGLPKITVNRQNGSAFEKEVIAAFDHVGGVKNTELVTVQLPSGVQVTTIPDMWGRNVGGLLEVKNVKELSMSDQLRAQLRLAEITGQPFNLVVSPRTQSISAPLRARIDSVTSKVGGGVYRYDPSSGVLSDF